jgi:hypothetical protein
VLTGFHEQINCDGCVSVFGSIGSFSAGFHGRKNLTENLSLIGGAAFAHYKTGGAEVTSAPIVASALRYDMVELGASRPFAEVGILASPFQRTTYSRNYANSGTWAGGRASVNTVDGGRWISFEGPARIVEDPDAVARAVELYAARYRQPSVNPARVVLEIQVERVLGSAQFRA